MGCWQENRKPLRLRALHGLAGAIAPAARYACQGSAGGQSPRTAPAGSGTGLRCAWGNGPAGPRSLTRRGKPAAFRGPPGSPSRLCDGSGWFSCPASGGNAFCHPVRNGCSGTR